MDALILSQIDGFSNFICYISYEYMQEIIADEYLIPNIIKPPNNHNDLHKIKTTVF